MKETQHITVPMDVPTIVITHGAGNEAHLFTDRFDGSEIPPDMARAPMLLAATVARLRILANLLGGEPVQPEPVESDFDRDFKVSDHCREVNPSLDDYNSYCCRFPKICSPYERIEKEKK